MGILTPELLLIMILQAPSKYLPFLSAAIPPAAISCMGSGIVTAFNPDNYTELRKSISVAVITGSGTGVAHIQQVQVS
mgnify:CR=1 FL=1